MPKRSSNLKGTLGSQGRSAVDEVAILVDHDPIALVSQRTCEKAGVRQDTGLDETKWGDGAEAVIFHGIGTLFAGSFSSKRDPLNAGA
jgi:hypothetical protein